MNVIPNLDKICQRIVASYRKAYGDDIEAIFLYGSYARGDYDEYSDIDFVAIVKGERLKLQEKRRQVLQESNALDLELDVITSPAVIPAAEFAEYADVLPYYRNIRTEGKRLA